MSALAFLLLVLALIGLIALLYYGMLCYPVIVQKSHPLTYDVEKRYLLPLGSDLNDNSEAAPAAPVSIPTTAAEQKRREILDNSYPSAPNSSQSPHEDDFFGSADVPADISGSQHCLDEPDCANVPSVKSTTFPVSQGEEAYRSNQGESVPLLHGDEEDGLILCQPSARSKNSGEPVPPVETLVCPRDQTTDIPQKENEQPSKSSLTSVSVPVDVQCDPSRSSTENQLPDYSTVTISEPIKVPLQENMSVCYPPSHMVVTIPQPLNVPPLMVAPIYDEPSIDHSPASLQQPLHSIVVQASVIPPPIELETYQEAAPPHQSDAYGWKDEVEMPVATATLETEADQPRKFSCGEPFTQEPYKEACVAPPVPALPSVAPDVGHTAPDAANEDSCGSSSTSSNASPEVSPRSKGSCTLSESSEPELSEYTFDSGRLCPSTKIVLENEISTVSNVQILRYTKIEDSGVLEVTAPVNDSTASDHPVDPNDVPTESLEDKDAPCIGSLEPHDQDPSLVETSCRMPDLPIARRSPDGDSMKSNEGESSAANSPKKRENRKSLVDNSPQKGEQRVDVPAKFLFF